MGNIDFTDCRRIFGKAYNGANGKKFQRTFYQTYIKARWEKLLLPAYELAAEESRH